MRRSTIETLGPWLLLAIWGCAGGEPGRAPDLAGYEKRVERAEAFLERGQTRRACEELEAAIDGFPEHGSAYALLPRCAGPRIVEVATELTERHPAAVEAWRLKAHHEALAGDWGASAASWRRVVELAPQDPRAWSALAQVAATGGDFAAAAEAARQAWEQEPSTANAARLVRMLRVVGKYDEGERLLDEWLADPSSADAELVYLRAQDWLRAGELERAERALREAIREPRPWTDRAHRDLATVLERTGRRDEAAAHLERAERIKDHRELLASIGGGATAGTALVEAQLWLLLDDPRQARQVLAPWAGRGGGQLADRVQAVLASADYAAGDRAAGDARMTTLAASADPQVDLARAARALAAGDRAGAERAVAAAVASGPADRIFLRRASDLYEASGDLATADALRRKAATAPLL